MTLQLLLGVEVLSSRGCLCLYSKLIRSVHLSLLLLHAPARVVVLQVRV
jgi:hypothetical protein